MVACRSWTWTGFVNGRCAEVVGRAIDDAGFHPAPGEPHAGTPCCCDRGRGCRCPLRFRASRPAGTRRPDDERAVEEAVLLQVGEQGGGRSINFRRARRSRSSMSS